MLLYYKPCIIIANRAPKFWSHDWVPTLLTGWLGNKEKHFEPSKRWVTFTQCHCTTNHVYSSTTGRQSFGVMTGSLPCWPVDWETKKNTLSHPRQWVMVGQSHSTTNHEYSLPTRQHTFKASNFYLPLDLQTKKNTLSHSISRVTFGPCHYPTNHVYSSYTGRHTLQYVGRFLDQLTGKQRKTVWVIQSNEWRSVHPTLPQNMYVHW